MNNKDLVFGIQPVIEAITSGKEIDTLFIQRNVRQETVTEIFKLCKSHNIPYKKVPVEKLNRITRKNHQGVIAFISSVQFASVESVVEEAFREGRDPFLIILDRVTDVRNFGAIARTAECAGIDAIVIPSRGASPVNEDSMKTSAGALNHLAVCRDNYLQDTIQYLKSSGLTIVGMTEKGKSDLFSETLTGPIALLMGSEEDGIQGEYLSLCDKLISIPMSGKINSLNVSVSAGVGIYEIIRQRKSVL